MINATNSIMAIVISALVNAVYVLIMSGSSLIESFSTPEESLGIIESFTRGSKMIENFWPHIIEGWAYGFFITLISCFIFLAWLHYKTPNKALVRDAGENPPAPHS